MVTIKQIDGHTVKGQKTIWQINTVPKKFQVCIQKPERGAFSQLLTIARIDRNHETFQLTLNFKSSYPAIFQLTLKVIKRNHKLPALKVMNR